MSTPTWNPDWVPDFVFTQSFEHDTIITSDQIGPEYRRYRRTEPIGSFTLNFNMSSKALAASIVAFYVDRGGPFKSFNWANPVDGNSYVVRFAENAIKREEIAEDLINLTVKFRQLL